MENEEEFKAQFKEIITALNDPEFISKATNEELMGYLFMAQRVENRIQELVNMENQETEEPED